MRESLLDKDVMASTESPVVHMLPDVHVVKIGGRSIIEGGRERCYAVVDTLLRIFEEEKLILSTGGGARTRHVFSIGIDLGIRFSAMQVFDALLCGFKRRVRALVFRRIEIGNGSPRGPFQVANPDYMACLAVNAQLWHRFWCLGAHLGNPG